MRDLYRSAWLPLLATATTLGCRIEPEYGTLGGGRAHDRLGAGDTGAGEPPCADFAFHITDLEVTPTRMPTVVDVTWRTDVPASARLAVTDTRGATRTTEPGATPGTRHRHRLTGLAQLESYELRVFAELDGELEAACGAPLVFETGGLSSSLPPLQVRGPEAVGVAAAGYRTFPVIGENVVSIAVVDESGAYVWAKDVWLRSDPSTGNMPTIFRAELAADGSGVVYNTQAETPDRDGKLVWMDWTGEVVGVHRFPAGHTDFVQLPDGGSAMLTWNIEEREGRAFLGDGIVERAPDGTLRGVWDVFDLLEPDLDHQWREVFFGPDGPSPEDWSHVNSLFYDPQQDAYYVTITVNDGVARIDRESGAVAWMVAGTDSDLELVGTAPLSMPHSVQTVDGGLLVFNRRIPGDLRTCSGASELALDPDGGTATEVWSHLSTECRQVSFLGNAVRLPSGNTLTSWSVYGVIDEVTRDGRRVWEVGTGIGAAFGFVSWSGSLAGAAR